MPKSANDELHDALVRHQTYLLRYSSGLSNEAIKMLKDSEDELVKLLRKHVKPGSPMTKVKDWVTSVKAIRECVKPRLATWKDCYELVSQQLEEFATVEAQFQKLAYETAAPVILSLTLPSEALLEAIATHQPFEGALLKQWFDNLAQADARRIAKAVQDGMVAGEGMDRIVDRVIGTGAMRGRDAVVATTNSQLSLVVRTAVQSVANAARDAFLEDNADIIEAELFVATLDSRTTPQCRDNDGKKFPLGKGPRPPLHIGCRSLRVAYFDGMSLGRRPFKASTEKMLLSEYASSHNLGNIKSYEDLPRGTKTPFNKWKAARVRELTGQVPADTDYSKFLASQSVKFQEDTLGITKSKLFRLGKLPLDRFVDINGRELTLKQIAQRDRQAFIDAGLDPDKYK